MPCTVSTAGDGWLFSEDMGRIPHNLFGVAAFDCKRNGQPITCKPLVSLAWDSVL